MNVGDILKRKGGDVVVIRDDATVHAAIRLLNSRRIGALVVTDAEGAIAGILSERDILRECGARCDEASSEAASLAAVGPVPVRAVMTADVITGSMEDDLNAVMNVMTEKRIRHLPIVEDGTLAGMISIGDAVKACVQIAEAENEALKAYVQGGGY